MIIDAHDIVDVNVYVDRWPFRRLPHDEPQKLVVKLRQKGIVQAWTSSFDGLLHRDISAVNHRLVETCRQYGEGLLQPVGVINPTLPGWQEDVAQCADLHNMFAIRIHPNYHRYKISNPVFTELLDKADEHNLLVQLTVKMEDERTQHPLVRIDEVDVKTLTELLNVRSRSHIMLLNSLRLLRGEALSLLAACEYVTFESAMLEGVAGYDRILNIVSPRRMFFGSYFPFFYLESAILKLQESDIGAARADMILRNNAAQLLNRT